jgi:hypothetical protein
MTSAARADTPENKPAVSSAKNATPMSDSGSAHESLLKSDAWQNIPTDRPVTVPDLFSTFCKVLHIDPLKENQTSLGRPIKIVEGGSIVQELFT